jgi:hypothetical protein
MADIQQGKDGHGLHSTGGLNGGFMRAGKWVGERNPGKVDMGIWWKWRSKAPVCSRCGSPIGTYWNRVPVCLNCK